ncbi:MAG: hypothetical protein PVG66_12945 [Chromatiales bacterium]|jgi:hypothetical protein
MKFETLFSSEVQFRQAFVDGLRPMVDYPELGAYILALANASQDAMVHEALAQPLQRRFRQLDNYYRPRLQRGEALPDAPDDLQVFDALLQIGFDSLETSRTRQLANWQLQYNPLRALRPNRMSSARLDSMQQPFNEAGFHFAKAFLDKEMLWRGELGQRQLRLLYNKFPFVDLHSLLVLDAHLHKPQWLLAEDHEFVWSLLQQIGVAMPDVVIGYNSIGAYASVNHQHFQMALPSRPLPIEAPEWRHNGGEREYPVSCQRFSQVDQAWQFIEQLQEANQPFNLLYRPEAIYCLPRAFQGSYAAADWSGGFAWAEVCGCFTLVDEHLFGNLQQDQIEAALRLLKPQLADA